ncbi:MAG: hypothetical protein ACRCXC_07685 [Legionella sp.]
MTSAKLERLKENINELKNRRHDLMNEGEPLLMSLANMTETQLEILNKRFIEFIRMHDGLVDIKEHNEWRSKVDLKLFDKANKLYSELEKKLIHSRQLDKTGDPTWRSLYHELEVELEALEDPDKRIRIAFLKHFGSDLQEDAAQFLDDYKNKMEQLARQKELIKNANKLDIDESILEAEIEKQLKLVQAQVILAMTAGSAKEQAERLKLAAAALTAGSLALAGAGVGVAIAAVGGSSVPIAGTAAGAVIGLIIGGVIGGIKSYHAYQEAKQLYQEQLETIFHDRSPNFDKSVSINVGIGSIKLREAFIWLMQGPQEADFQKMLHQFKAANKMHKDQQIDDLKIKLQSEFAASRGAYFSMLHDIIRASTAYSALQAAAGLTAIASPFYVHSAVDLATQFTLMCHSQIGTARAVGGLDPLSDFPIHHHIDVDNAKKVAHETAAQLASNAESLAALAHQLALCTNLDEQTRRDLLVDIHNTLINTIATYDELVRKKNLDLKPSLG